MKKRVVIARKRSTDPAQEHLREQKAIWNQSTKVLISKLIAFKRGLNGRGDPKAGLPVSDIKEPFPPQIGQYLSDIATHYTALIDGAEKIIQEQENYSNIRRKPQPDTVSTSNNQTLSIDDGLSIKTAAWWGSRWWASNFGIKGSDRPIIKSMLRSCVSLHSKLLDIENHLTSSDPNGIPKALYVTSSFGIGPYKNILEAFNEMRQLHGRELSDPPKENVPKPPVVEFSKNVNIPVPETKKTELYQYKDDLTLIINDLGNLQSVVNHFLGKDNVPSSEKNKIKKLKGLVSNGGDIAIYLDRLNQVLSNNVQIQSVLTEEDLESIKKISSSYSTLLNFFASVYGEQATSFEVYAKKIQNLPDSVAHNSLSRFVKKKWLEHKPDFIRSDVDLDMRKNVTVEHISDTINAIEKLMDVLVKAPGIDEIFRSLKSFSKILAVVVEDIITLAEYHTSMFRNENRNNRTGVVLHPIIEREINKLRKANVGIKEMSDKILINRPDIITVVNG